MYTQQGINNTTVNSYSYMYEYERLLFAWQLFYLAAMIIISPLIKHNDHRRLQGEDEESLSGPVKQDTG